MAASMCDPVDIQIVTKQGAGVCDIGSVYEWDLQRIRSQPSEATLDIEGCDDCFKEIEPWCHELRFSVGGELVWVGPVLAAGTTETGFTVSARDRSAYLSRFFLRQGIPETATWQGLWSDVWGQLGECVGLSTPIEDPADQIVAHSVGVNVTGQSAIRQLSDSVVWWSVVGDRVWAGSVEGNRPLGPAIESGWVCGGLDIPCSLDGSGMVTDLRLRYGPDLLSWVDESVGPRCGCPLSAVVDFPEILNADDARTQARRLLDIVQYPERAIVVDGGDLLLDPGRLDWCDMIPGGQHGHALPGIPAGTMFHLLELVVSGVGPNVTEVQGSWDQSRRSALLARISGL